MDLLWKQNIIDTDIMKYYIVLSMVCLILSFMFSIIINIGSHISVYEYKIIQNPIIIFILANPLLSLMFFISLCSFENASYLEFISGILIMIQIIIYFYWIVPIFLNCAFRKSMDKIKAKRNLTTDEKEFFSKNFDNLDSNSVSQKEYKKIAYISAFIMNRVEPDALWIKEKEKTNISASEKDYKIFNYMISGYCALFIILIIIEIVLISTDSIESTVAILIYSLFRMLSNVAFLVYCLVINDRLIRFLRKEKLLMKISPIIIMLILFNIQKPIVALISIIVKTENQIEFAMILNYFLLSVENLILSIIILLGYCFTAIKFDDYKVFLANKPKVEVEKFQDKVLTESYHVLKEENPNSQEITLRTKNNEQNNSFVGSGNN